MLGQTIERIAGEVLERQAAPPALKRHRKKGK
jgi:hypothetical protein